MADTDTSKSDDVEDTRNPNPTKEVAEDEIAKKEHRQQQEIQHLAPVAEPELLEVTAAESRKTSLDTTTTTSGLGASPDTATSCLVTSPDTLTTSGLAGDTSTSPEDDVPESSKTFKDLFGSALKRVRSFRTSPKKPREVMVKKKSPKSKGMFQRAKESLESAANMFVASKVARDLTSPGEGKCFAESDELGRVPSNEEPQQGTSATSSDDCRRKSWSLPRFLTGTKKSQNILDMKFDETNDPLVHVLKGLVALKSGDEASSSTAELSTGSQANSETELIKLKKGPLGKKSISSTDVYKESTSTDEGVLIGPQSSLSSDQYETDSSYIGGSSANVFLGDDTASGERKIHSVSEWSEAGDRTYLPSLTEQEENVKPSTSTVQRRRSRGAHDDAAGKSSPDRRSRVIRQRRLSEVGPDSDTEDDVIQSSPHKRPQFHRQKKHDDGSQDEKVGQRRLSLSRQKNVEEDESPPVQESSHSEE